MIAPEPIRYETPYKVVILSELEQLIVKNGYPCIDAGYVEYEGNYVPFAVRYDNKPELAAQIDRWQSDWIAYNNWRNAEIDRVKATITTPTKYDDKAENDVFAWTYWDGTNGNQLFYKPTGQYIYQMCYLDGPRGTMRTKITGEEKEQVMLFWAALKVLQAEPEPLYTGAAAAAEELEYSLGEPAHGQNGYCRKCHSYCWGDCEANL